MTPRPAQPHSPCGRHAAGIERSRLVPPISISISCDCFYFCDTIRFTNHRRVRLSRKRQDPRATPPFEFHRSLHHDHGLTMSMSTQAYGARTIYSVINNARATKIDYSPRPSHPSSPSESSFSSGSGTGSGSSYAPSDSASPQYSSCHTPAMVCEESLDADFDATNASQLSALVPSGLRKAIQAAKYNNLVHENFDTGICWEALPTQFAIPNTGKTNNQTDEIFPMLSDLSIRQALVIHPFLYKCRDSVATWDEICRVADRARLYGTCAHF